MKITNNHHLCYSLNVYPGQTWSDKLLIFEKKIPKIKKQLNIASSEPFGIGLWLDANTVNELQSKKLIEEFKLFLESHNYYVFTVNAFPYGAFHKESVKTNVYVPDWTTQERLEYTKKVADILAELIPNNITGSISTVPGSYSKWITTTEQCESIALNILETAKHLREIHLKTGKKILLSIEMEPDCLWESPDQFISFYDKFFREHTTLAPYIGVCYDTCHQELLNNKPGDGLLKLINADITISKIQLSAALGAKSFDSKKTLKDNFSDNVYLHQTRIIDNGVIESFTDLDVALNKGNYYKPWIIHFHIPVYLKTILNGLTTEKRELEATLEILSKDIICTNIELETYTYDTLPQEIKSSSLEESIAREYQWIINKLNA